MCGRMGSGLMPGNAGLISLRISTKGMAGLGEDACDDASARAVHGVDEELVAGGLDGSEIDEVGDGGDVVGVEIDLFDLGWGCGLWQGLIEVAFDGGDDGRLTGAAVAGLVLHTVPLGGVVAGGDHDAAGGLRARARRKRAPELA